MKKDIKSTYVLNGFLAWIPKLRCNEFKVYLNLCSWTGRDNRTGWVPLDTLASGQKPQPNQKLKELGSNLHRRSVQRILKALKSKRAMSYEERDDGKGIQFELLSPSVSPSQSLLESSRMATSSISDDNEQHTAGQPAAYLMTTSSIPKGFTMLPHEVVRGSLNGNALKFYTILKAHSDKSYSTYGLCKQTGVRRPHDTKAIDDLRAEGLAIESGDKWCVGSWISKSPIERAEETELLRKQAKRELERHWERLKATPDAFLSDDIRAFIKHYLPDANLDVPPVPDALDEVLIETLRNQT